MRGVHELGSPAFTPNQILAQSEPDRESADSVLVKAEELPRVEHPTTQDLTAAAPVSIVHLKDLIADRTAVPGTTGGCTRLAPSPAIGSARMAVAPGHGLYLSSRAGRAAIFVRRLARHAPSRPLYLLPPNAPVVLSFPRDASTLPWHVRVVATEPLTVCAVR